MHLSAWSRRTLENLSSCGTSARARPSATSAIRLKLILLFIGIIYINTLIYYICIYIIQTMKLLKFVGSSLDDLKNFPEEACKAAGFELSLCNKG